MNEKIFYNQIFFYSHFSLPNLYRNLLIKHCDHIKKNKDIKAVDSGVYASAVRNTPQYWNKIRSDAFAIGIFLKEYIFQNKLYLGTGKSFLID
jgi:hypothetical protein